MLKYTAALVLPRLVLTIWAACTHQPHVDRFLPCAVSQDQPRNCCPCCLHNVKNMLHSALQIELMFPVCSAQVPARRFLPHPALQWSAVLYFTASVVSLPGTHLRYAYSLKTVWCSQLAWDTCIVPHHDAVLAGLVQLLYAANACTVIAIIKLCTSSRKVCC